MFETCDKYGIKLCSQTAGLTCPTISYSCTFIQDFVLFRKTDEGDAE